MAPFLCSGREADMGSNTQAPERDRVHPQGNQGAASISSTTNKPRILEFSDQLPLALRPFQDADPRKSLRKGPSPMRISPGSTAQPIFPTRPHPDPPAGPGFPTGSRLRVRPGGSDSRLASRSGTSGHWAKPLREHRPLPTHRFQSERSSHAAP